MKISDQQDKIISMYLVENLSIRNISDILTCSCSGVRRILNKNNVPMRNKCDSLNLCPKSFTEEEFDIIYGTILGDGHVTKRRGPDGECQLSVGHGYKQIEYIKWKSLVLDRFVSGKVYPLSHFLKSTNKTYITFNFVTRKSSLFTSLREDFYSESKKILPHNFSDKINPRSLAVWYMDDGHKYKGKNNIELHTQCFSHNDQCRIVETLKEKFCIESYIRKISTGKEIIFVPSQSCKKFISIVDSYVVPSLKYKTLLREN